MQNQLPRITKIPFPKPILLKCCAFFLLMVLQHEFLPDLQLDAPELEKWASHITSYNRKGCNHCLVPLHRSSWQKRGSYPWRQTLMRSSCSIRSWMPWKWRLRSTKTCRWKWWRLVWHGSHCAPMGKRHTVTPPLTISKLPLGCDCVMAVQSSFLEQMLTIPAVVLQARPDCLGVTRDNLDK